MSDRGSPIPGAIAPEALQAVGLMAEDRRDVGLLAITSADRLYAGWTAAQRARLARNSSIWKELRFKP